MENVEFADENLDRLETDAGFTGGFSRPVIKGFRKRMQQIRAALDEREFYRIGGMGFEKLKDDREGQYGMRLNDQYRLILTFEGKGPSKTIRIIEITDYH